MDRKDFIKKTLIASAGIGLTGLAKSTESNTHPEQVGFNHLPIKDEKFMQHIIHRADTRGHADHGWLITYHTFSFASYYNPERTRFGVLRVLNDDTVAPGMGFGTHPHDNMEIISIPLDGDLEHKDSMGNVQVIKRGDVQVMSAGTGIYHSEYNRNKDKQVKFLQIWVFPSKKSVTPRYDQLSLDENRLKNKLFQILSPNADDDGVWIHQNAWFHMGKFDKEQDLTYKTKLAGNGIYLFVLEGTVKVNGAELGRRDGMGISDTQEITISTGKNSELLLMEVPMN